MKVTLFTTCIVDFMAMNVGKSTVELLEGLGHEIDYPKNQTCCGQPTYNTGYVEKTKNTIKHFIETFEHAEVIVSPSGSCVSFVKEYPHIFADDKEWKERAEKVAAKTYELSQFLMEVINLDDFSAKLPGKAVYHHNCHTQRFLKVKEQPLKLLSKVEGLELVDFHNSNKCCGFGGTFSVKMGDISAEVADEKARYILEANPDYLIGADYACLMNIGGRLSRLGSNIKVMHLAEVLNSK